MSQRLEAAIADKKAVVGVIGLGYVGLPLINAFVNAGFKTIGFDVDQQKVDLLKAKKATLKRFRRSRLPAGLTKKAANQPLI
ncbi:MAG: NAD(P)-binding domain-containing protein [Planctomycetaceae bacterium]